MSRIEDILTSAVNSTEYNASAQSRVEALLIQLKEKLDLGGASASDIQTAVNAYLAAHPEAISGGIDEDDLLAWLEGGN